jgi:hypothetical protein
LSGVKLCTLFGAKASLTTAAGALFVGQQNGTMEAYAHGPLGVVPKPTLCETRAYHALVLPNASYTESRMHEIRTDIEIKATPERVWSILLDFPSHRDWNPFVRSIEGVAKVGDRLKVFIQPQGGKGMTFRPAVLTVIPNAELRWLGRFLLPGIFDGEHYFQINQIAPGHVSFIQGERFSGVLVPFAKSSLDGATKAGFIAMNQALKSRAESTTA